MTLYEPDGYITSDDSAAIVRTFNEFYSDYGLDAEHWFTRTPAGLPELHIRVTHDLLGVIFEVAGEQDALDAFEKFERRVLDVIDAALRREAA